MNKFCCPDCGGYWPAHVDSRNGKIVGCPTLSPALVRLTTGLATVIVRRALHNGARTADTGSSQDRRGHVLVSFRECRDLKAGTVLTLDLDTGEYFEPTEKYLQNSKRLRGLELEKEKDRLEDWLGYKVRVVGR